MEMKCPKHSTNDGARCICLPCTAGFWIVYVVDRAPSALEDPLNLRIFVLGEKSINFTSHYNYNQNKVCNLICYRQNSLKMASIPCNRDYTDC